MESVVVRTAAAWCLAVLAAVVRSGLASSGHAYVGRMLKLAYLAPAVLEKLLIERVAPVVSVKDMAAAAELPWTEQAGAVFADQGIGID